MPTFSSLLTLLRCPQCARPLTSAPERIICDGCQRSWPLRDGIPSFAVNEEAKAPEKDRAAALLQAVSAHGWERTVHFDLPNADMPHYRRIFDPRLIDWCYRTDLPGRELALDLGCGWGGRTLRLARLFERVVALEPTWELALFTGQLLRHEGIEHALVVHAPLDANILAPASCDLIVLDDAYSRPNPAAARSSRPAMLRRSRELLRAGGVLCLGVTNSHRWLRPTDHRPALQQAGFTDITTQAAFPSYHHPRVLVPLAAPEKLAWAVGLSHARRRGRLSLSGSIAHRVAALPAVARVVCRFSRSLIHLARRPQEGGEQHAPEASKAGLAARIERRVLAEWEAIGLPGTRPYSISIVQFSGNWDRGGKVNWFVFPRGAQDPAVVVKIARLPAAADRVRYEHELLTWLRSLDGKVENAIPRAFACWEVEGHAVALQEPVAGSAATSWLARLPSRTAIPRLLQMCFPILKELARCTGTTLPAGAGHPRLVWLAARAHEASQKPLYPPETQALFRGLGELVSGAATRVSLTLTHHGDMSIGDVLGTPQRFRILDWEWSVREGIPFVDLIHLTLSVAERTAPSTIPAVVDALAAAPTGHATDYREVAELAAAYCDTVGVAQAERRGLVAAALLELMLRKSTSRLSETDLTVPAEADASMQAARALLRGKRATGAVTGNDGHCLFRPDSVE